MDDNEKSRSLLEALALLAEMAAVKPGDMEPPTPRKMYDGPEAMSPLAPTPKFNVGDRVRLSERGAAALYDDKMGPPHEPVAPFTITGVVAPSPDAPWVPEFGPNPGVEHWYYYLGNDASSWLQEGIWEIHLELDA